MRSLIAATVLAFMALAAAPRALAEEPASRTLARDGLTLHYKVSGAGDPILLLSGGPGFQAAYMSGLVDLLDDTHTVILLEQRGTGRSTPATYAPSTVSIPLMIEDMEALRRALELPRWTVLGHSFGALTAMRYAAAHPDTVQAIVLLSTVPPLYADLMTMEAAIDRRMDEAGRRRTQEIYAAMKTADEAARSRLGAELMQIALPTYFADPSRIPLLLQTIEGEVENPQTNRLLFAEIENYDLTPVMAGIRTPTLIVQGEEDVLEVSSAEKTRAAIPGARLTVLPKVGHFAWLEAPEPLRAAVVGFLREPGATR